MIFLLLAFWIIDIFSRIVWNEIMKYKFSEGEAMICEYCDVY
jgi:hypothetical protein